MSEKQNGRRFQTGVMLGGRQYTITLQRDFDQNLQAFAAAANQTPNAYLQHIVEWSIKRATWEWAQANAIGNLRIYGLQ